MKRLEQLESTHGIIEMYEFLVHYETVLNDWRKSRIKIIKEHINFKSQTSFKYCFFCHVFFFPLGDTFAELFSNIYHCIYYVLFIIISKQ